MAFFMLRKCGMFLVSKSQLSSFYTSQYLTIVDYNYITLMSHDCSFLDPFVNKCTDTLGQRAEDRGIVCVDF